jgi:hypothetical protein
MKMSILTGAIFARVFCCDCGWFRGGFGQKKNEGFVVMEFEKVFLLDTTN